MDYDKTKLPETYVKSRQLPAGAVALWMDALAEFLSPNEKTSTAADDQLTILDLGSGTGRFSVSLAEAFDAKVIGVEPSEKMRSQADAVAAHPEVTYVSGFAEEIPCEDDSCAAAFLSMVIHHFPDIPAACGELFRILKPGGCAFVRNAFKGSSATALLYKYFPSSQERNEARIPSIEEVSLAFDAAGIGRIAHRVVTQPISPSFQAYYERIKLRGISTLRLISDDEFDEGIEAMRRDAQGETNPEAIMEDIDLLVFQKCDRE